MFLTIEDADTVSGAVKTDGPGEKGSRWKTGATAITVMDDDSQTRH